MMGAILTAILAAASPSPQAPPQIGYLTAGQLAEKCSENAAASASYCFAYIAAVTDAMRAYEIWLNIREFCPPPGAAQADMRRAFMTYLSAYPTNNSGQAASVIIVALKQTYPCLETGMPKPPG